jgi:hypothetical protein
VVALAIACLFAWYIRRRRKQQKQRPRIDLADGADATPDIAVLVTPFEQNITGGYEDVEKAQTPPTVSSASELPDGAQAAAMPTITKSVSVAPAEPNKSGYEALFKPLPKPDTNIPEPAVTAAPQAPPPTQVPAHEVDAGRLPPMYNPAWRDE